MGQNLDDQGAAWVTVCRIGNREVASGRSCRVLIFGELLWWNVVTEGRDEMDWPIGGKRRELVSDLHSLCAGGKGFPALVCAP